MMRLISVRNLFTGLVVSILSLGLFGCDYWPPALQIQIEQLRSEVLATAADKTQLENQLASIAKVKDDLLIQVTDLERANREKSAMIGTLQNKLVALQVRSGKAEKDYLVKATPGILSPKNAKKPQPRKTKSGKSPRPH